VVVSTSRVIVVDPDGALTREIAGLGLGAAVEVRRCASPAEVERGAEVLIAAAALGESGPELLAKARRTDPDGFRILAAGDPGRALRALNEGCADAVLIDHDPERLRQLVHDGCETALTRRHWRALIDELAGSNDELTSLSQRLQVTVEERTATLAQAQLLLKQQQEELVRLETQAVVSQLVRGLAHELNNPLAAILGYAQRLRRTWAKDEDTSRRLDVILGEVDRCRSLVEQLRNLAAPLEEEPVPCSVGSQLTQAAERLAEAGQTVPRLMVAPDVPAVLAAPHSLVRVFEQVLENAMLAGARTCWLTGAERDGRVRLRLENDGATPDDASVRNATRPFYTTMASKGRRGLGLAIATALLREQNGNLELAQREGAPGAACLISLPARPAPVPVVEPRESARGGTVLVVDDEPLVAELLLDALEEGGLAGRVVGSVAEAVLAVEASPLRALIVDVRLPDGNGVDLARRALELRPELTGHIALITGSGEDWAKLGIPANAKWPVLGKPFRLEQIAKLVQSIA
jgi:signal transduction histidine kinase/CheY-like chemotaxis protein